MNTVNSQIKTIIKQKLEAFLKELASVQPKQTTHNSRNLRYTLIDYLLSSLHSDKKAAETLVQSLKQLSYLQYVPRTKGRLCGGLLAKGQKAYKCYECMTQQNSVLCQKCFELDKHIGHDFERFQVFGGCCDCGDIQKWKETGFCTEHSKDEVIEIILDENQLNNFLEQHTHAFELLMQMYCKFLEFEVKINEQHWNVTIMAIEQRAKEEIITKIRKIIDFYGVHFFQELVEFNKAGKYANAMTSHFFDKKLTIPVFKELQIKNETQDIFTHMFTMLKLKDTPQKICDLCITLFPVVDFRQKVTMRYLQCYNNDWRFPTSTYTHLSSQLLTSHLMITKLIKQGRINALSFYPKCADQDEVQKLAQGFMRYYYDMKYLSKLYGSASVEYFKLHASEKKFVNLGEYRIILNQFPRAIDYYGLDQIFLDKMLFVIKVFQKDQTHQLQKSVLRQLYHFITTYNTEMTNKFRPQERFLTLIIFNKVKGNLDLLDDDLFMQNIFECLGVKDFRKEIGYLIRNLNSVLLKTSQILQNTTLVNQNYTFYSFYLKKSQKLFNLDCILLKILYKMTAYYNKINQYQYIRFDGLLLSQCIGIQKTLQKIKSEFAQIDQQENRLDLILRLIKTIKNYVSFVLQALFSDLPQLAVMCALQPTQREIKQSKGQTKMPIQNLARHYYLQLLQSEQTNKVLIKSFKASCELFFREEQVFRKFVTNYKDPIEFMKLNKPTEKANKISEIYFRSLNILPANKYTGPFNPPYCKWNKNINLDDLLDFISNCISLVENENNKIKQNQSFSSQIEYSVGDVPQLLVQVWKIIKLTQSQRAQDLLKTLLEKEWISKELSSLGQEMANKIKSEKDKEVSFQLQKQKKQQQKRKLMQKKKLLNQKINKRAEMVLQKEAQAMVSQNQNEHLCSLCKEHSSEQHLSLFGFVSFTCLFGTEKSQKLVAVFDTCGHAAHKSCLTSIMNKNLLNKVYSFCPLCKSPTNIQFPIKQHQTLQERDLLFSSLKKVYEVLEYEYKQLDIILRSSLVYEIVFKGLMLPEVFQKNLTIYKIIYQIYQQHIIQHPPNIPNYLAHVQNETNFFKKVFNLIENILTSKDFQSEKDWYKKQGFSEQLIIKSKEIISKLKNQHHTSYMTVDCPQISTLKNYICYPPLQKNLASMNSKYRGKCQQCGLITNQQVICLNCPNFVTCSACEKMRPSQHSRKTHFGVNVFVKTSTGEVIYYMRTRFWKFPSIYEDYMGRAYLGLVKQRQHYELNQSRLVQVKKDIYLCRVEQKVRYKQNETKQVNHQQIF